MTHSFTQLPEEILLIILKKLKNHEALYSLLGVNERLDTIIKNPIFTKHLTLIPSPHDLSDQFIDTILDRFDFEILPNINDKIERLDVDSSFMKRVLRATNYPNC